MEHQKTCCESTPATKPSDAVTTREGAGGDQSTTNQPKVGYPVISEDEPVTVEKK